MYRLTHCTIISFCTLVQQGLKLRTVSVQVYSLIIDCGDTLGDIKVDAFQTELE